MTTVTILNYIKEFLAKKVASNIKLQKPNDNNIRSYELVNPNVFIGWIPPEGYLADEVESAIPCLIVGMDEGNDGDTNASLNIRLSFAVYSPGEHVPQDDNVIYTPSFQGYIDLLNFIDLAKAVLIKNTIINNAVMIDSNVKWSMYKEQPYPYWYGWIAFSVKSVAYPKVNIEKLL